MSQNDDNRPNSSTSTIPPPSDPFPTYQTPYTRTNSSDKNPFIEFRRAADESISSLFQGLPKLFGFGPSHQSWQSDIEDTMKRRHELEEGWRKQVEQEMEEARADLEKRRQELMKRIDEDRRTNGRMTDVKDASATAVAKGSNGTNGRETSAAERCPGLRNTNADRCPALNGQWPRTELDAYEGVQTDQVGQSNNSTRGRRHGNSPGNWLTGVGYDGQLMQMMQGGENEDGDCIPATKRYTLFGARRLDPISNTNHTLPWLLLSPYSPVYLCNPGQKRLFKVNVQDNAEEPFRIERPKFLPFEREVSELDEKMAKQVPWADAFEDLLSLEQAGKMVERDSPTWRTPNTWMHDMVHRGSLGSNWGFDEQGRLVKKSAGEQTLGETIRDRCRWYRNRAQKAYAGRGAQDAVPEPDGAASVFSSTNPTTPWTHEQDAVLNYLAQTHFRSWKAVQEYFPDKSADACAQRYSDLQGTKANHEKDNLGGDDFTKFADDLLKGGPELFPQAFGFPAAWSLLPFADGVFEAAKHDSEDVSASDSAKQSTFTEPWSSSTSASYGSSYDISDTQSDSLVSTLTTSVSRTLPDGSIETKRVLKKKFADGREENNESVEVSNLPTKMTESKAVDISRPDVAGEEKREPTPLQQQLKSGKKGGWFWT